MHSWIQHKEICVSVSGKTYHFDELLFDTSKKMKWMFLISSAAPPCTLSSFVYVIHSFIHSFKIVKGCPGSDANLLTPLSPFPLWSSVSYSVNEGMEQVVSPDM